MIDWRAGYHSSWRVYRVNPDTWADAGLLPGVTEITVERGRESVGPTLESGSMSVDVAVGAGFEPGYYRIVMLAEQNDEVERVELATLWCESSSGNVNRGIDQTSVTCSSVLHPAQTTLLEAGSYAPAGVNGAMFVADMLSEAINAPVVADGSFTLDDHYVFDAGQQVIDACWKLLDAGSFVIRVSGDGTVHVTPKPTQPSLSLDSANARLLHPGVEHTLDYSQVPNRYKATDGTYRAEAVNDDPSSITSTVRRGFFHDANDTSPVRVNGETLGAYATRMLREKSTVLDERTYEREWWPDVFPGDVVKGSLPSVDLDGDMRVQSQNLACGRGVIVTETSAREVILWQG